jgi:hypothetical protein
MQVDDMAELVEEDDDHHDLHHNLASLSVGSSEAAPGLCTLPTITSKGDVLVVLDSDLELAAAHAASHRDLKAAAHAARASSSDSAGASAPAVAPG